DGARGGLRAQHGVEVAPFRPLLGTAVDAVRIGAWIGGHSIESSLPLADSPSRYAAAHGRDATHGDAQSRPLADHWWSGGQAPPAPNPVALRQPRRRPRRA